MSENFFDLLRKQFSKLRFTATGAASGHVLTARPSDESAEAKQSFLCLLGILGGGLVAGTILIFKSLMETSTSQILGVNAAQPLMNPLNNDTSGIALFGYCMQARRKTPNHDEEFGCEEKSDIPTSKISLFLEECDKNIPNFVNDYFFLEKLGIDPFTRLFKQSGTWVITDNIGFGLVRETIFPDYIFFTTGPMEILLRLAKCLKDSNNDVYNLRFGQELIQVCQINHKLGFISDELHSMWQREFGIPCN